MHSSTLEDIVKMELHYILKLLYSQRLYIKNVSFLLRLFSHPEYGRVLVSKASSTSNKFFFYLIVSSWCIFVRKLVNALSLFWKSPLWKKNSHAFKIDFSKITGKIPLETFGKLKPKMFYFSEGSSVALRLRLLVISFEVFRSPSPHLFHILEPSTRGVDQLVYTDI